MLPLSGPVDLYPDFLSMRGLAWTEGSRWTMSVSKGFDLLSSTKRLERTPASLAKQEGWCTSSESRVVQTTRQLRGRVLMVGSSLDVEIAAHEAKYYYSRSMSRLLCDKTPRCPLCALALLRLIRG